MAKSRIRLHFIGSFVPEGYESKADAISTAGNICQKGIVTGFNKEEVDLVQVISYFPNRLLPLGKRFYEPARRISIDDNASVCYSLPYLNIPIFRSLCINFAAFIKLLLTSKKEDVLLFYNVSLPSGVIGIFLRCILKVRVVAVVFDVHVPGQTVPKNIRSKLDFAAHKWLLPRTDGIVAITSKIIRDFKCFQPSLVVEGGIDPRIISKLEVGADASTSSEEFVVVFAGRLDRDNGVELLLDAMKYLPHSNLRLVLAGDGQLRSLVQQACYCDTRITYLGLRSHDEIIELYKTSNLLACVRLTENLNTGYFFPSKLLEYMSSGVPILATPVVADSFDVANFAFLIESETAMGVADAITKCMGSAKQENIARAARAKKYAAENLVWPKQSKRIVQYLNILTGNKKCSRGEGSLQ